MSPAASILALALLVAAGVLMEFRARRGRDRATAAQAIGAAMRTTPGRLTVLAAWVWVGVHFLAR